MDDTWTFLLWGETDGWWLVDGFDQLVGWGMNYSPVNVYSLRHGKYGHGVTVDLAIQHVCFLFHRLPLVYQRLHLMSGYGVIYSMILWIMWIHMDCNIPQLEWAVFKTPGLLMSSSWIAVITLYSQYIGNHDNQMDSNGESLWKPVDGELTGDEWSEWSQLSPTYSGMWRFIAGLNSLCRSLAFSTKFASLLASSCLIMFDIMKSLRESLWLLGLAMSKRPHFSGWWVTLNHNFTPEDS